MKIVANYFMKKTTSYIKHLAPWAAAVAIFVYLFHVYPPKNIYNSLQYMNIGLFGLISVSYMLLMFVLDTYSISRVLRTFGCSAPFAELLPARGSTYLLMVVNYAAGQAAFAFYQYRKYGIPISRMLGIFSIIVVVDLFILVTIAFVATFFTSWPFKIGNMEIGTFVRIFTAAIYIGFALAVILLNKFSRLKIFERLLKNKFLNLIATTGFLDYFSVGISRLPVHIFILCGMYVAMHAFMDVPFVNVISNIPIVFFIGSLPITPGGVGTSNVALVELFKPFVSNAAISSGAISAGDLLFSFSLAWLFANYLMKALIGVICLKFVSRDLFKPTDASAEKEAEHDAAPLGGNI